VEAIDGNLVLGIAKGTERFLALCSDQEESPQPGEVIYFDDSNNNVMCRRWNWRNGDQTKIDLETQKIVINVDCLPPITSGSGKFARDELADLLSTHCKAELETYALHSDCRSVELT